MSADSKLANSKTLAEMDTFAKTELLDAMNGNLADSLTLSQTHYENFPVASHFLPKHLRNPIALIYTFARQADDFADEGNHRPATRLANLQGFKQQLDLIKSNSKTKSPFFTEFGDMIREYNLPLTPFYTFETMPLRAYT